jgi:hypothetical protein
LYHEVASRPHSVAKQTLSTAERRSSNNSASAGERKEVIWTCFASLTEELTCMDRNGIDPHPVIPELERWKGEEEEKKIYI